MLDATQPVLHRRRPGHRGRRRGRRPLAVPLQQHQQPRGREQAHLAQLEQQRVQGILRHPGRPRRRRGSTSVAARGRPLVIVDRTRDDDRFCSVAVDDVLGGRLAVEHLIDQGHTPGRLRRRPERARPGPRPARRAPAPPGPTPACRPEDLVDAADGRAHRRRGPRGRRAARRPARSHRGPTAAFCANDLVALGLLQQVHRHRRRRVPERPRHRRLRRHRVRRGRRRAAHLGAPAPRGARPHGRPSSCSTRPTTRDHLHQQVLFTPELVARASSLSSG